MVSASVVHTVGALELHERRVLHPPRRGQAGAAAGGLHEARPRCRDDLGLVADVGERDRLERGAELGEAHGGGAHEPAARVAGVDDPAVLDLDPGREVVGEAERARRRASASRSSMHVGRRVVVVGEPGLERALEHRAR